MAQDIDSGRRGIEREREALTVRIAGLKSSFDGERGAFQTQLEALAKALSWTSPKSGVDERLSELDRRLEVGPLFAARGKKT